MTSRAGNCTERKQTKQFHIAEKGRILKMNESQEWEFHRISNQIRPFVGDVFFSCHIILSTTPLKEQICVIKREILADG